MLDIAYILLFHLLNAHISHLCVSMSCPYLCHRSCFPPSLPSFMWHRYQHNMNTAILQVLLLGGTAGAGKTTFLLWLQGQLLRSVLHYGPHHPVFVSLPSVHQPFRKGAILDHVQHQFSFTGQDMEELQQRNTLFILDRYRTQLYMLCISKQPLIVDETWCCIPSRMVHVSVSERDGSIHHLPPPTTITTPHQL